MLIWLDDKMGDADNAALDSVQCPRSLAQFRALMALSIGGVSREELDELAGVSNSPALIQSLDVLGFRVGRRRWCRPGTMIWSADRSELKAGCYQYALTELGAKVMNELVQPRRRFRHPLFGYRSYCHALLRLEQMFAHAPAVLRGLLSRNGYGPVRVGAA